MGFLRRFFGQEPPAWVGTASCQVFADYHQFYVWDAVRHGDAPEDYTAIDVQNRVKLAPHLVVIQPVRNTTVPVAIELSTPEPSYDADSWDHIVEGSLALPSGRLQVHECTGGAVLERNIPPGTYGMRALFAGLSTLSADGLDGDDRYCVQLWPGPMSQLRIVKEWRER